MKRKLYSSLLSWKSSKRRKPLLLQGARQVGKTWLINEFGQQEYQHYVYLNFEQSPDLRSLFSGSLKPADIIKSVGLYIGKKIEVENTLICFDEVQVAPEAITSLKYFQEQAPEYHLIAAGSLLGVHVAKPGSFPVGKVNFLTLYPMSFEEFAEAMGEKELIDNLEENTMLSPIPELLHQKLLKLLKLYFFIGGMPEAVKDYVYNQDISGVREIQLEILKAYERDFSKYTEPSQVVKTSELWQSVPFQLSRENKKFKYSDVRKKGRASMFEQTIEWLRQTGLIHLAYLLRTPKLPIAGYADYAKFKIYLLDTGLLGAMLRLSSEIILQPTQLFVEYNGAFTENFVAHELVKAHEKELYYWNSPGTAEVDFILSLENELFPVEVKSGSSRNTRSLRSYADKYQPSKVIRLSPRNFMQDGFFINLPLYATSLLPKILEN